MSSLEAQLRSNIDEDISQVRAYNTELVAERANLRAQERQIADLDGRAESMIIDILGAQRAEEARAVFDTSDIDTRLSTLTQVQDKAKARTSVSSEMSSDNIIVNAEYLDNNTATIDLESRLSFMDSHPVEVSRANIDEQLVQIGRTLVEKEHVPQG